jgi:hypothetical protein
MSGKDNCYDNASVKAFFKFLKVAMASTTSAIVIHIWTA